MDRFMKKTKKLHVSELVEDFDLYPRSDVNSQHVTHIVYALEAGVVLPPVIIDEKTKRIVDGFHRCRAHKRLYGEDAEIECVLKTYDSEQDLFLEAVRLNSGHGQTLSSYDKVHSISRAMELKIDEALIADALHMKSEKVIEFRQDRIAKLINSSQVVPLKLPARHLSGQTLTLKQSDAIEKLSGNAQAFTIYQVCLLLENDLLDRADDNVMEKLARLRVLIEKELVVA